MTSILKNSKEHHELQNDFTEIFELDSFFLLKTKNEYKKKDKNL